MPSHHRRPMTGRDPLEPVRGATPLELLYDLTFVVAIGLAAHHFAEFVAHDHVWLGLIGFGFGMFAILNAWIDFSWFASAFDTDDWVYRLLVMVQMVGVVILALGIEPLFHSLEHPEHGMDLRLIVIGYVVMRVALVAKWVRVVLESTAYDVVGRRSIALILVIQLLWLALAFSEPALGPGFALIAILGVLEVATPMLAQAGQADGTPWHGHHIAERYGLLAIIALGEGVVGTVASSEAALGSRGGVGWDQDAVLLLIAGIGLTFAMWWSYFQVPFGDLLHHRPSRGFVFGYGHLPIFISIAALGAGLHVAALDHQAQADPQHAEAVSSLTVVLAVAIPAVVFIVGIALLEAALLGAPRGLHLAGTAVALLLIAGALTLADSSVGWALILVMLATFAPVAGFELGGHRLQKERIDALSKGSAEHGADRPVG